MELRKARGLKQSELADHLGITQNQISKYERGESNPTMNTFVDIIRFFDTSADYLLGLTDVPDPVPTDISPTEAEMLALLREYDEEAQRHLLEAFKAIRRAGGVDS